MNEQPLEQKLAKAEVLMKAQDEKAKKLQGQLDEANVKIARRESDIAAQEIRLKALERDELFKTKFDRADKAVAQGQVQIAKLLQQVAESRDRATAAEVRVIELTGKVHDIKGRLFLLERILTVED